MPALISTREALLEAALLPFDRQGYDATTVAQLCRAAGASNGSFFHHFGSKEGLAAALFVRLQRRYHAALLAELADAPGAAAGVARLVRRHLAWVVEQRAAARFLFEPPGAAWPASGRDEQTAEAAAFSQALEHWRGALVAAGDLPPLPLPVFVAQCLGPAQAIGRVWLLDARSEDPRRQAESLATLAVHALVGALPRRPERAVSAPLAAETHRSPVPMPVRIRPASRIAAARAAAAGPSSPDVTAPGHPGP